MYTQAKHICRDFALTTLFLLLSNLSIKAQNHSAENWFTIKAFLPAWKNAEIQLHIDGTFILKDTLKQDVFSHTGKIKNAFDATLRIAKKGQVIFIPFFVEPGIIKLRDQGSKIIAYNSPANNTFHHLQENWDAAIRSGTFNSFATANDIKRAFSATYILKNPGSIISLRLLYNHFYKNPAANETEYYKLYQCLEARLKATATGKKIEAEVMERYATAVGNKAPLAYLPDTLKALKPIYNNGQITLINFWASWCLPCLKEIPALHQLYNNYRDKGLDIISVSMDTNRASWLNSIQRNKFNWTQLNDLKGWDSPAAKSYGLKLIPQNLLIGRDGIILGKNLHISQVEDLLKKHM